ncbi:MAG TPA: hypothetical protein VF062_22375 [Candidatus Limnocylindrales bacterium]
MRSTPAEGGSTRQPVPTTQNRAQPRFRPGDAVLVRCPRLAYWRHPGVVVGTHLGEVGVRFGPGTDPDAWFLPSELARVR